MPSTSSPNDHRLRVLRIEQQGDDAAFGEEGFEPDQLAPEARRVSGDQPDLEQRIVDQTADGLCSSIARSIALRVSSSRSSPSGRSSGRQRR
jgi:hypothetical protein